MFADDEKAREAQFSRNQIAEIVLNKSITFFIIIFIYIQPAAELC